MDGVWASMVAVAGTLLGVLATGLLQRWMSARAESEARVDRLREAAVGLADALTDYRERLYWELRLKSQPETTSEGRDEALRESWAARSQVNHAMNRLELTTLDAEVLSLAAEARNVTFGIALATNTPDEARAQQTSFLAAAASVTGVRPGREAIRARRVHNEGLTDAG